MSKLEQVQCQELLYDFNATRPSQEDRRKELLSAMFAQIGEDCQIEPPIYADWGGKHVYMGKGVRAGVNLTLVDTEPIHIGDHVTLGPNVTVLSGITIGENAVIGAGSVVTEDIPANAVAEGNPCRVVGQVSTAAEENLGSDDKEASDVKCSKESEHVKELHIPPVPDTNPMAERMEIPEIKHKVVQAEQTVQPVQPEAPETLQMPAQPQPPQTTPVQTGNWIDSAVFYHIYPMGFCGAADRNEGEATAGHGILKLLDWIPHLKAIGINAVYFSPIFQSLTHGYDTSDYFDTDSRLGTKDEFKQVFAKLRENHIHIVLDGVFNHVGRGFWAFKDVQEKLWDSPYKDWFSGLNFDHGNASGDRFHYDCWEGHEELVKLNLRNPAVVKHLLDAVSMWIDEFDIDGLRLDAADCVDMDFFRQLRSLVKGKKPHFWLMGEIIHGDYKRWANPDMLDSTTNYECWKGIYSSHNDKNYFEIAHSLKRQFGQGGMYKDLELYSFVDNHDVNRIASLLNDDRNLKNVYTLLFAMPGVPSIYYGSEWGIKAVKGHGYDADKPLRPCLDIHEMEKLSPELGEHIRMLSDLRACSTALQKGEYEEIFLRNRQYAFARVLGDDVKVAAFNIDDSDYNFHFDFRGKKYEFTLKPYTSCII